MKAPRALELDFRAPARAASRAGGALLALALVFSAHVALSYRDARDSVADKERRLARLGRPAAPAPQAASREEIAFAGETLQRLATPWDNLFGALESTASDQVALLAIEPDAKTGAALIRAEARDYLAALNYVLRLQEAPALHQVRLVRHELRPQAPPGTVAFAVRVTWKEPQ
jgi:hypothetical protein